MAEYRYKPLPDGHIRRLTIHPGPFESDIVVSLDSRPFNEDSPPSYEALSYTWGSPDNSESIWISENDDSTVVELVTQLDSDVRGLLISENNYSTATESAAQLDSGALESSIIDNNCGTAVARPTVPEQHNVLTQPRLNSGAQSLSITANNEGKASMLLSQNLFVALRYLRFHDIPRVMWIDAICIDQFNDIEKGPQVAMMGDIYRLARRVLVWLGPEKDDSDIAMRCMEYIGSQVAVNYTFFTINATENCVDNSIGDREAELPFHSEELASIHHLLNRPWFKRLWIRQEIFLANPDALILCGHSRTTWITFRRALVCLSKKLLVSHNHFVALFKVLDEMYGFIFQTQPVALHEMRDTFRKTECFDPRDRLYAISSLLYKDERELYHPDYSKSVIEVYREVALNWIKYYTSLNILRMCELRASPFGITWVPDWSAVHTKVMTNCSIRASSQLKTWYHLSIIPSGILRVAGVSATLVEETQLMVYSEEKGYRTILESINELLQNHDLNGYYVTGITRLEAYTRTLLCDITVETVYPKNDSYPELHKSKEIISRMISKQYFSDEELGSGTLAGKLVGKASLRNGKRFIRCTGGYIGISPPYTQPGDQICVLLGCDATMVLRESENGKFQVVGECFMLGFNDGEALLGPLPSHVRGIQAFDESDDNPGYIPAFINDSTGEIFYEDPRLEALGVDLLEFREDLAEDPQSDLELGPEFFKKRGVDIKYFDLV